LRILSIGVEGCCRSGYNRPGGWSDIVADDAMDNIIVPLYHMRCYLAKVRVVREG